MKKKIEFNFKNIIILILVICILSSVSSYLSTSYALEEKDYPIHSEKVEYNDNFNLGATDVQAAINNTCTRIDTRLSSIEKSHQYVNYTTPFTKIPSGYTASAYKENGVVVLSLVIPAGTSGWFHALGFELLEELKPRAIIPGNIKYDSVTDRGKISIALKTDGTIYGNYDQLNSNATAVFIYPAKS